jgi:hypothetical protein
MSVQPIAPIAPQTDNGYDYNTALRARLAQITDLGTQQNQYVMQRESARQQAAMAAAQQAELNAARQQSQQSISPVASQQTANTGPGKYANNPNPRSVQQALQFAQQAVANGDSGWYRRCLAFVAQAYGLASGSPTARAAYNLSSSQGRVVKDMNPNIGAVMWWDTPGAGHAGLYAGNGMVYSTDISGKGRIGLVPIGDISRKWGAPYLGWSDPYFAASPRR